MSKIKLQFKNGDTFWHQGDTAAISMLRTAFFEKFAKKFLCPRASPLHCTVHSIVGQIIESLTTGQSFNQAMNVKRIRIFRP